MGILAGLALLLVVAIPASIAPRALIGAYVVIAVLALGATGAIAWLARRSQREPEVVRARLRKRLTRLAVAVVVYVALVSVIHATS